VAENSNPFAMVFGTSPEVYKQASPLSHVSKGLPPFLLLVAEAEVPRLAVMAEEFAAALKKAGNKADLKEINGCTHQNIINRLHKDGNEVSRLVLAFIKLHAATAQRSGS